MADWIEVGKKRVWVSGEVVATICLSAPTILSFCLNDRKGKNAAVKFEVKAIPAKGLMGRSIYIADFREPSFMWATKVLALRRAAKTIGQPKGLTRELSVAETELVKAVNSTARVLIGRFFHYKGSKRRRIVVFLLFSPDNRQSESTSRALLAETRIRGRWSFLEDSSYCCCISGAPEVTEARLLKEEDDLETETAFLTLTGEKNRVEILYRDEGVVKKMVLGRDCVLEEVKEG